ncbi:Sensory domain found in PocR [Carpediemonas membranifera]|uniref:Sensory domain found in PocR n=1 Tax=Carpediemonas membranifera TaxID=201153 RepID=A0A8J6E3K3_9EUKA|nr:Sensory domain found in PocR [Carpediemonas membranifera]|eukprot:KAG9396038.1 Sensory domain found in PocR [Carpediemonas membranifera]
MEDIEEALRLSTAPHGDEIEVPTIRGNVSDFPEHLKVRYASLLKALDDVFIYVEQPAVMQNQIQKLAPFFTFDPDHKDFSTTSKAMPELFDMDAIQILLDKFTEYANCSAVLTDTSGQPLGQPSRLGGMCSIIRGSEEGNRRCFSSDQQIGSLSFDHAYVGLCHSGTLTDGGSAVQLDGVAIASILIGGIVTGVPSVEDAKIMVNLAKDIGHDPVDFVKAFRKSRRKTMAAVQTIAESLHIVGTFLSQQASKNYAIRRAAQLQAISSDDKANTGRNTIGDIMNTGLPAIIYALWWKPTDRVVPGWVYLSSVVALACGLLLPFLAAFSVATPMSDTAQVVRDVLMAPVAPSLTSAVPAWGGVTVPLAVLAFVYAGPVTALLALNNTHERMFTIGRVLGRYAGVLSTTVLVTHVFLPLGFLAGRAPIHLVYGIDTDNAFTVMFTNLLPDMLALGMMLAALAPLGLHAVSFAFAPTLSSVNHLRELLLLSVHISVAFVGAAIGAVEFDDTELSDSMRVAARLFAVAMSLASLVVALAFIVVSTLWPIGRRQKAFVAAMLGLAAVASLVLHLGALWSVVTYFTGVTPGTATAAALALLALLSLPAALVPMALLHVRLRMAEEHVFAIMFSETGDAATKKLALLRNALKPGKRAANIKHVAAISVTSLKLPTMADISVTGLELGTRPFIWHDRRLFGRGGISSTMEANLFTGANMVLRRACVAYTKEITPPLRLALLNVANMGPASISTSHAMLRNIAEECFAHTRVDHGMFEFSMHRYIEQMQHVFTLGGKDNAASFLEIQSKLTQARSFHLRTLFLVGKFWPLLLRRHPDLPLIIKHARSIGISATQANLLYTRLFRRYPDNPTVREWYILFLDSVMQDHTRAQQLRTETVDDDTKSNSSESHSTGSSFSGSSTGSSGQSYFERNSSTTFFRILLAVAAVNVALTVLTGGALLAVSELMRDHITVIKDLHNVSFAVGEGSFFSSLLYLNDTRLDALDLEHPLATSISAAAEAIESHHDFLIDMDHGSNEYYYFYEPDEVPVIPARAARKTWAIAAGLAHEMRVISESTTDRPADITLVERSTVYSHAQAAVAGNFDSFAEIVDLVQELQRSSILGLLYVCVVFQGLLVVVQLAMTVVLIFWIIFRNFSTEVVSCDISLTNCLSVSRAQVRRQMRLVGMAKSKFRGINMLDFDQDLQEDLSDGNLATFDDGDKHDLTKKQLGATQLAQSHAAEFSDDSPSDSTADEKPRTRPGVRGHISFLESPNEIPQPEPRSAFEMIADESSGSEVSVLFVDSMDGSDAEEGDIIGDSPIQTVGNIVKKLAHRPARGRKRKQASGLGVIQGVWSVLGVAGILVAMAVLASYSIYSIVSQQSATENEHEIHHLLDMTPIQCSGTEGYDMIQTAGFAIAGATDRLRAYVARRNDPAVRQRNFDYYSDAPEMWMSDEMVTVQTLKQQLLYYMDVAVSIAAYGHGFTSDITTGLSVDWNYTGETHHAQDVEEYSRPVWYTNKTSDTTTLAAADQLAIAQAILFDDKVETLFMVISGYLYDMSYMIVDSIEVLIATSFTARAVISVVVALVILISLAPVATFGFRPSTIKTGTARRVSIVALLCLAFATATIVTGLGVRWYVTAVLDPDTLAADAAELSSVLEGVIDMDQVIMHLVQKYVYTVDEGVLADLDAAVTKMLATTAKLYTLGADATGTEAFAMGKISHARFVQDMYIATRLAASVNGHTIENAVIDTYTWNSNDPTERASAPGRFTNETYDLARSDAEKQAMAESLCLTDPVTYADYDAVVTKCTAIYVDYRDGIHATRERAHTALMYADYTTAACLIPVLVVVTFVVLPTFTTTAFTRVTRRHDSKYRQKQVLNRTLRPDFALGVSLLLSVTVVTVLCAMAIVGMLGVIYEVYVFVSDTAKTDSLLLKSGTRAALSYEYPASVHPAMLDLETDALNDAIYDVFNAGFLDYVFTGAWVLGLTTTVTRYVSALTAFTVTSTSASSVVRSGVLMPVLKTTYNVANGLSDMFNNRFSRLDLLVSFNEVVLVGCTVIASLFVIAVNTLGLRAVFRHLMSYSGSLTLLQSYLVR